MEESKQKINDKFLDDYIKIMIYITWQERVAETGMTVEEEEKLRDDFVEAILNLSPKEMVDLGNRAVKVTHKYLKNHPERGLITFIVVEDIICGFRYSNEFLKRFPTIKPSDPRAVLSYSKEEGTALKQLFLNLKKDMRESDYFRVSDAINHVTGEYIDFMTPVYKKYAKKR